MKLILSLLVIVLVLGPPVQGRTTAKEGVDSKSYLEAVVNYWKKTRPADSCGSPRKAPEVREDLVCNLDQAILDEIQSYQDEVNAIIDLFITGSFKGKTFELLANLTDTFGPRLTGSQALEDAIDWVLSESSAEGFSVSTEDVTAPHWERNRESLVMTSPRVQNLPILSLGSSVGTPAEGISAELLVVSSFDELTASAAEAAGKIVLFDVPFTTYGETVTYRSRGATEAAKVGAVAALVRSVTPFSIASPHTGGQNSDDEVEPVPGVAITIEDSAMLHRLQDRGETIVLNLTMGAQNFPDVVTRNTIVEIEGTENPEEVVVVSGHLDSWDVGTGAMDDAGGCTVSWMAGRALKELALAPRRTFRTVMFTAEEQGIYGGEAYFLAHGANRANFQLMMESDFGTFYPRGIGFSGNDEATCIMQEILNLTELLGTTELLIGAETPDLGAFGLVGVPRGSLNSDSDDYFYYHHSQGDRMEIYEPDTLDRVAALWTAVSYVTADVSFRLPHSGPAVLPAE